MSCFRRLVWVTLSLIAAVGSAAARDLYGSPENYRELVAGLRPGDRLVLAPGDYRGGLAISGKAGSKSAPIVIQGARSPGVSRFLARPGANTVSLRNVSHVVIDSLALDGGGLAVDAVKAEGDSMYADHVTLSRLAIVNHGANRQIVGISTKCPAFGWIVRDNTIVGAGTGMYFGDSDGTAPFVGGLIERNLIVDTIGYNMEIKHQLTRPRVGDMPTSFSETEIRRNIFVKAANSSTYRQARPNLLIGHLPIEGPGSGDRYLIHGNAFLGNPTEVLLQAEGNVVIYNNVFINRGGDAIVIRPHNHRPRNITLFNNTVIAGGRGILVAGLEPGYHQAVYGNLLFAGRPLAGAESGVNVVAPVEAAENWLAAAVADSPVLDLALSGERRRQFSSSLAGSPEPLPDADLDFMQKPRREAVPGAFATEHGDLTEIVASVAAAREMAAKAGRSTAPRRN